MEEDTPNDPGNLFEDISQDLDIENEESDYSEMSDPRQKTSHYCFIFIVLLTFFYIISMFPEISEELKKTPFLNFVNNILIMYLVFLLNSIMHDFKSVLM